MRPVLLMKEKKKHKEIFCIFKAVLPPDHLGWLQYIREICLRFEWTLLFW